MSQLFFQDRFHFCCWLSERLFLVAIVVYSILALLMWKSILFLNTFKTCCLHSIFCHFCLFEDIVDEDGKIKKKRGPPRKMHQQEQQQE